MGYFLGVDAGGTNTSYILADDTHELARVQGGTIKRMRANADVTEQNLHASLEELTRLSGVKMRDIARTCVGAAGFSVPLVADWIKDSFGKAVGGELILVGDVDVALDAAFEGGAGVLVIAGTGSNVAGRSRSGQVTTAGGWGPALADQGSGHFIGLESLRRSFLAIDEERESFLLGRIMAHWGTKSLDEMVEKANTRPAPDYSELSRIVVECAAEGDPVAADVLRQGGEDLAYLVLLVIGRMHRYDHEAGMQDVFLPEIAITGSILKSVEPVRKAMADAIQKKFSGVRVHTEPVEGVKGAIWKARKGSS